MDLEVRISSCDEDMPSLAFWKQIGKVKKGIISIVDD